MKPASSANEVSFKCQRSLLHLPSRSIAFCGNKGCIRKNIQVNLMLFHSFALTFYKLGCIRKNIQVNLMLFHSFALTLQILTPNLISASE